MDHSQLRSRLAELYGSEPETVAKQTQRYTDLMQEWLARFGPGEVHFFRAPGRTEIGGNHTDHNHGRVLAASVDLDAVAVAAPAATDRMTLYSAGYPEPFVVALHDLTPHPDEHFTTTALMRGIAARFRQLGFRAGGFNACVTSEVKPGSGLSSSAAIEVLLATMLNTFYNGGTVGPQALALIGQYAENVFFQKPCGLMDQITSATGGIVTIDFEQPQAPQVEKVDFDFSSRDYRVLVVDTGGTHADLTADYAAIPREMKAVAGQLGRQFCRQITREQALQHLPDLRRTAGDRAVLRALHFLDENERVLRQVAALRRGDFAAFLHEVNASGNSSMRWLQNCFTAAAVQEQGLTLALWLTEQYINTLGEGACRVHGGGFAGTIQAFLPARAVADYAALMEPAFAPGCVQVLDLRPAGAMHVATLSG